MVCPNCQSTNIVAIANEHYCINCGQLVPEPPASIETSGLPAGVKILPVNGKPAANPAPKITPKPPVKLTNPTPATPVTASTPSAPPPPPADLAATVKPAPPKRRGPGRPKAGRLDIPPTPATEAEPVEAPASKLRTHNTPALRRLSDLAPTANGSAAPAATPPNPTSTMPAAPPIHRTRAKPPAPAAPTVPPAVTPPPSPAAQTASAPDPLAAPSPGTFSQTETISLKQRFRPHTLGLALVPAIFVALPIGVLATVLLSGRGSQLAQTTARAGWPVWGELILLTLLYYLSRNLTHSAIAYGTARHADHRPAPPAHWLGVAVNSFSVRTRFDVIISLLQLGAVGLIASLVLTGGSAWPVPVGLQALALLSAFSVLLYLLAGLGLVQGLGRVGVTLGDITARRALHLGWILYRHHAELVGWRIVSLIIELMLILPLGAALAALTLYLPSSLHWIISLTAVVVTAITGALLGAGSAVWWQALYRGLIHRDRLSEAVTLLASRAPHRPRPAALGLVGTLATALILLAIAWPWLPFWH